MFQPKSFQDFIRFQVAVINANFNETTTQTFRAFRKQLGATGIRDERVAFEYLSQVADSN